MPSTSARLRAAWHGKVADDPDDPEPGDWWYNTSAEEYRGSEGGEIVAFDTTSTEA